MTLFLGGYDWVTNEELELEVFMGENRYCGVKENLDELKDAYSKILDNNKGKNWFHWKKNRSHEDKILESLSEDDLSKVLRLIHKNVLDEAWESFSHPEGYNGAGCSPKRVVGLFQLISKWKDENKDQLKEFYLYYPHDYEIEYSRHARLSTYQNIINDFAKKEAVELENQISPHTEQIYDYSQIDLLDILRLDLWFYNNHQFDWDEWIKKQGRYFHYRNFWNDEHVFRAYSCKYQSVWWRKGQGINYADWKSDVGYKYSRELRRRIVLEKLDQLNYCIGQPLFSEGLSVYKEYIDDILFPSYGYVDENEDLVIDTIYGNARPFNNGLAWVLDGDELTDVYIPHENRTIEIPMGGYWGLIDRCNNFIIKPKYDYLSEFIDGVAIFALDLESDITGELINIGKFGIVDYYGNEIVEAKYNFIYRRDDGAFHANIGGIARNLGECEGGKWGLLNTSGVALTDFKYDDIRETVYGYSIVRIGGQCYNDIDDFDDFDYKDATYGYLNSNGTEVIPLKEYHDLKDFYNTLDNFSHEIDDKL